MVKNGLKVWHDICGDYREDMEEKADESDREVINALEAKEKEEAELEEERRMDMSRMDIELEI